MKDETRETIRSLTKLVSSLPYIPSDDIPDIALYMDQVTTLMEDHLGATKRNDEDKIMTKTMINNYAKNDLIPSPVKKKYNKEQIILLMFIYYYKNLLCINDINSMLSPIIEHFYSNEDISVSEIYDTICELMKEDGANLEADVTRYLKLSEGSTKKENLGPSLNENEKDIIETFALLNLLSNDIYRKQQLIFRLLDSLKN